MERRKRTCRCGHDKSHALVIEEPEYTLWGWILLSLLGISPKPDHIVYRCQTCRQSLGTTRDPKILARRGNGQAPTAGGTASAEAQPKSAPGEDSASRDDAHELEGGAQPKGPART